MNQSCFLLINALVLGFRHGIDWDHIAAIADIVGTATSENSSETLTHSRPLLLSSMYAFGHAAVVAVLGVTALYFATVLPPWVDPIMERLVGGTLLFLGAWIAFSLVRHHQGGGNFRLQSRWMLIFALIAGARKWFWSKLTGQVMDTSLKVRSYGAGTAFSIGMIHGIGAETGSQILLLAAIGGASSHDLGAAMLLSFIAGLLISNTSVAIMGTTSFISARRMRSLYVATGAITCCCSLVIGSYFALGRAEQLPDLHQFFGGA